MINKSITDFLSDEYKEFALYVLESRAIPSVIDSFKSSQRKIIHISNQIWKTGTEKTLKVFQLSGKVASDCFYHHGDCLDPETEILIHNGEYIKLIDWYDKFRDIEFDLICYDEEENKFTTSKGHSPRIGSISNIEYEIEMDNGEIFKCTNNHPFLTKRGWVTADNLTESDEIVSLKDEKGITSIKKNNLIESKVFYDITVDKHHNFVIGKDSMLVTHNSSLSNAIVNMAQKFKNNLPLLEEDGQFGSLRSPQAGAPRYIGTKLSKYFKLIYKDFELIEYKFEEGEKIEPHHFLPIIPTILLNGGSGIAVGFSSNILNRNVDEVIQGCIDYLKGKKIKDLKPCLNGFKGEYIQDSENKKKWTIRGKFERKNSITIVISELPPSMTYEKYESHLDKLVENKNIVSYDDNCKDDINYTIKITRSDMNSLTDDDIVKLLKLEEYQTEIFTTLDEFGKLKIFESSDEIIKYFIDFRIKLYQKRKDYTIDKFKKELKLIESKGKFIKLIIDGKIIVNNQQKEKIILQIENNKLEKIDNSYDYLLRMPIYSLTKELFEKLKDDFKSKKIEIDEIKSLDPKTMYLNDLNELKKKI